MKGAASVPSLVCRRSWAILTLGAIFTPTHLAASCTKWKSFSGPPLKTACRTFSKGLMDSCLLPLVPPLLLLPGGVCSCPAQGCAPPRTL